MNTTNNSILDSVKLACGGIPVDYSEFDDEIVMHINTVFSILTQLGVGPVDGFSISDNTVVWSDYYTSKRLNDVRTYVSNRVRLIFDPPTNASLLQALKEQIAELEWRLTMTADTVRISQ